ncbi:MAG: CHASE3 domain-containing protein, partial [Methylovirgula sp.]
MRSLNIKIAKKLAVAFGCMLFVVATTSLFVFAAVRSAESSAEAYGKANLLIADLERAITAQFDQAHAARGYLITNGVQRHAMLYENAVKEFDTELAIARTHAAGQPEMLAELDKVEAANIAWRHDIGDQEVNLGHNPQTMPQAIEIAKSAQSTEMMKAFRAVALDAGAKFGAWAATAHATEARTMWFMQLSEIIGSLLALMVAVLAGYMLSRRIAVPIRILNGCMKTLAQGDTRVEVPSMGEGDEIGDMAQTIQTFKTNAVEKMRLEAEAAENRRLAEEERLRQEIETQKYVEAHNRFVASITD